MNNENTIKKKMEQSSIAAMGFAAVTALLTLITAISRIVDIFSEDTKSAVAESIGACTDSLLMCILSVICVMIFKKIGFSGKPFSSSITKLLSASSAIFLLDGFIPSAAGSIYLAAVGETVTFDTNKTALYIGIFLLFLTHIFRYGTMLQQENDDMV